MRLPFFVISSACLACSWSALATAADKPTAPLWMIRDGQPLAVHTIGQSWRPSADGYNGHGMGQYLIANAALKAGDFHIQTTLGIEALKESAASLILGESEFVFEGPDGEMLLRGQLAGGKTKKLGKPPRALRAGHPMRFEIIRTGENVTFKFDDNEIAKVAAPASAIDSIILRPWRANMTIAEFSVQGDTTIKPARWQLPWVDLAKETERQVVIERATDTYLGHPDTVMLRDGKTIFVTYPLGHGGPAAVLRRSDDGGRTWTERLPVPENWATATNCPTLHRLTDSAGVERLILFEGKGAMRQSLSTDEGKTWTPLKPNGLKCVVAPIQVLSLSGGRHIMFYQWRGQFDGSGIYQAISHDGGLTWGEARLIADLPGASLCEPGYAISPDGTQIVVLIRENSRRYPSLMMTSTDEGRTWSPLVAAAAPLTGDRHNLRITPEGRVVAVYRDMAPGSPTYGDFVAWVGSWADLVLHQEGDYRVRLLANPARWKDTGYAGLEQLTDGSFLATTYVPLAKGEPPSVVCVRFDLKELDQRAAALKLRQQDLWSSGEGGYNTYRIPALITSQDGTLLAFCEGRKDSRHDAGDIDLLLRRSTDGGQTWGPVQVVWDDGANTCGNPCPVVDQRNGRIWLLATHNLGADKEKQILDQTAQGTRTVWTLYSDDHGQTWSSPREITAAVKRADWTWYATGPGVGIQLRDSGRLVIPCDFAMAGSKQYCSHVIYSDDAGATWQIGGIVEGRVNECQIVELADGDLMLNMRSYYQQQQRAIALSKDGGQTFGAVYHDPALIEPVCQASLIRYTLATGADRNRLLFLNPADTKRKNMTLKLSYDEGRSWPVQRVLHAGPAAYSSLAILPNGQIGCFYECGDQSAYETLQFARVDLRWLSEHTDFLAERSQVKTSAALMPSSEE